MKNIKIIAVLCNYRLLPERVGGMDRFFWALDQKAQTEGYQLTWFFPNEAQHGNYAKMHIIANESLSVEDSFLQYQTNFDLVVTHFLEICTPFFKTIKQKRLAHKTIVVDHNPRPLGGYNWKKQLKKRWKGWFYAKYIHLFVGVSAYTIKELQKDFGSGIKNKCRLVYNGIEMENYQMQENRKMEQPRFLVVSHLRHSKGIQDLIQAVAYLPGCIKQKLQITVYGEGPYQQNLLQLAKTLHVESNFIWMGSSSNLSNVFCYFDYLLHPTHMECFSLTLLESLCANVPVITTPVGGNEEVVIHGTNGWILPAQQPKAWAELIAQLWHGEKKITSDVSKDIREKFALDPMVEKHLELIKSS
jgi:glycosyltransferase involved in cell wall biosynthesis